MIRVLPRKWRVRRGGGPDEPGEEDSLRLRRELQESRLELAERDRTIERLRAELTRAREVAGQDARQRSRADMEQLVEAIGAPVVQLLTQAHLHRTGTAQVRVEDALDAGTRLVRGLRDAGVDTVGESGEEASFDPDRHDPLSATAAITPGQPVVVRVPGLSYRGRIVRKAGVDRMPAEER